MSVALGAAFDGFRAALHDHLFERSAASEARAVKARERYNELYRQEKAVKDAVRAVGARTDRVESTAEFCERIQREHEAWLDERESRRAEARRGPDVLVWGS